LVSRNHHRLPHTPACQRAQTIFISVNFEEENDTSEADANDDDKMVRFEFIEGIVRAAFGKYITSK
jgi:hypothetical protein